MQGSDCIRVVGIDPGSKTLGIAILDCYQARNLLVVEEAWTLNTNRHIQRYPERCLAVGELAVRLEAIRLHVRQTLDTYRPDATIVETPYLGRLPQAFSVLTKCLETLTVALNEYSPSLTLSRIDPASAKRAVGVPGNSSDKGAIQRALMNIENLRCNAQRPLAEMIEHSTDAIAIGHYYCAEMLGYMKVSR